MSSSTGTLSFSCSGLSAHFQGNEWKKVKSDILNDTGCTVEVEGLLADDNKGTQPGRSSSSKSFSSSNYGNVKVLVTTGDITLDDSDVIVSVTNSAFELSSGPLSSALVRQAGTELQKQCVKNPVKKSECMRITNAGNLFCKYVIFLFFPQTSKTPEKTWLGSYTERIIMALEEAEMLGATSVALPAIGTGNIGMLPRKIAPCMSNAIEAFAFGKARKVKTIKLVIFQSSMLASFWNNVVFTKEVINQERNMLTTKYGEINVTVCYGDICCDNSQVIVNGVVSTNEDGYDLSKGAISASLLRKAGSEMQRQCNYNPIMKSECMRITNRGNTSCKYVIHLITPQTLDTYVDKIVGALRQAETWEANSVAIPALGTGNIGLPADKVAISMSEAFNKFASTCPHFVKTIKIYLFDTRLLPVFRSNVILKKELMASGQKQIKLAESFSKLMTKSNEIEIKTVEKSKYQRTKALNIIQSHLQSCCQKRVISDGTIAELQHYDIIDVYLTAAKYYVSITYSETDHEFILYGVKANVDKLDSYLKQLFIQFKKAVDMSRNCEWKFDKLFQNFTNLPLRISYAIEVEYVKNKDGKCSVSFYDSYIDIDFSKMRFRFCLISGKLERKDTSAEDLPNDWTSMMGRRWLKVPLGSDSKEYKRVLQRYTASEPSFKEADIVKIERVQNPVLYKFYRLQRQRIEKRVLSSHPVERELFHGTHDADSICAEGFDRGLTGLNAQLYSKGSCFTGNAKYSLKHADDGRRVKQMFLARVLTGNYCIGSSSMTVAPVFDLINDKYDSVADDQIYPTTFVVFRGASAYPYYLISFV